MITGASGFLGNAVLKAGAELDIVALGRQPLAKCRTVMADLNDPAGVLRAIQSVKPDVVVHLAWQGIPDFSQAMCLQNLAQARHLITAVAQSNCSKLLIAGSCIEYKGLNGPVHEEQWGTALDLLGQTKQAVYQLATNLLADRQCIWFRPFYVYGPGQRSGSLIPSLLQSVRAGCLPQINQPQLAQDFIHCDDVAQGIVRLLHHSVPQGCYNLGTGKLTFISQIAQWLVQAWENNKLSDYIKPEQGFFADNTRIQTRLNWQPTIDLATSIAQMVADAKRN